MKRLLTILLFLPLITDAQIITTFAGNGHGGNTGDGGSATAAKIYGGSGQFDIYGNTYVAEGVLGNYVRKISNAGIISTIAGTGTAGYNGDGGLADTSMINIVAYAATDSYGNIY